MRAALGLFLVVAAACGGISKRTIEEDPAAGAGGSSAAHSGGGGGQLPVGARGGTGGSVTTGGSGGSVAAGGTAGTPEPDLPDPCNYGWLDIPVMCPPDQTSFLDAPTCNAVIRCYLGSVCAAQGACALCLQSFQSGLAGTMSLCVHGTLSEFEETCRTNPPMAEGIPPACTP